MHDVITKTLPANMVLLALQREAAADIEAKTAARQDSSMIERDLSRGATKPAPAAEDPLDSVRRAVETACARVGLPMKLRVDYVIDEVRKLLPPPVCDPVQVDASSKSDNGLLTSHNPDKRGAL